MLGSCICANLFKSSTSKGQSAESTETLIKKKHIKHNTITVFNLSHAWYVQVMHNFILTLSASTQTF